MCRAACQVLGDISDVRCWRHIRYEVVVYHVQGGMPGTERYVRCKVLAPYQV